MRTTHDGRLMTKNLNASSFSPRDSTDANAGLESPRTYRDLPRWPKIRARRRRHCTPLRGEIIE
jgi:hypothetical protein